MTPLWHASCSPGRGSEDLTGLREWEEATVMVFPSLSSSPSYQDRIVSYKDASGTLSSTCSTIPVTVTSDACPSPCSRCLLLMREGRAG